MLPVFGRILADIGQKQATQVSRINESSRKAEEEGTGLLKQIDETYGQRLSELDRALRANDQTEAGAIQSELDKMMVLSKQIRQGIVDKQYASQLAQQQAQQRMNEIYLAGTLANQPYLNQNQSALYGGLDAGISRQIEQFYADNPELRYASSRKKTDFLQELARLNPAYATQILSSLYQ